MTQRNIKFSDLLKTLLVLVLGFILYLYTIFLLTPQEERQQKFYYYNLMIENITDKF